MVWIHVEELLPFHPRIDGKGDTVLGLPQSSVLNESLPSHNEDIDSDNFVSDVNKGHYVKMVQKGRWKNKRRCVSLNSYHNSSEIH